MAGLDIVEIARRNAEAWGRGDVREATKYVDRDVIYDITRHSPEGLVFEGDAGLREGLELYSDAFEDFEFEVVEVVRADDERVVLGTRQRGRGAASGALVEQIGWGSETIRRGKIVRIDVHPNREAALAAVGLDPGEPPASNVDVARREYEPSPRCFVAAGDCVVVLGAHAASGLETHVMRISDGKVQQMLRFRDEEAALREARLVRD